MLLSLTPEQAAWLEGLEAHVKALAFASSKEWFGQAMREKDLDRIFSSSLRRPAPDKEYPPTLKAVMVLSAPPEQESFLARLTLLKPECEDPDQAVQSGRGWAWTQPRAAAADRWRRCEVWPTLEFRSVWITANAFGLRVNYKECLIKERSARPVQAQAFAADMARFLLLQERPVA